MKKVWRCGENGAGKTTLLNLISGLLYLTGGSIYLFGQDITKLPPYNRVALGLNRSFQMSSLFPSLSLFTNVSLALHGIQKSRYQMLRPFSSYGDTNRKVEDSLKSIDLWDKKDIPANSLSWGEKRRLEMILTMSSHPKVLLLDEPSAGLSSAESASMIQMINNLSTDTTTLVIAHDLDFIYQLCQRVMVLYYGEIIADGSSQQIQVDPKIRQIYFGSRVKDARIK